MKDAILLVSFGTSYREARERDIEPIARAAQERHPGWQVVQAYTSRIVRGILKKRGISVPSIEEALEALFKDGVQNVVMQPTLILPGAEFDKLARAQREYQSRFQSLALGAPLLNDEEDIKEMAQILQSAFAYEADSALVLMGHGTTYAVNSVYRKLNGLCAQSGRNNVFIGTVEAEPGREEIIEAVAEAGYKKACLAPLMLVAGDHALVDMAGEDEDSWKRGLEAAGIAVQARLTGLGALPQVQTLLMRHLKRAMDEGMGRKCR